MSITTRNRALPLIMRSQASAARSSGTVSTIGRMPLSALKASVSSESAATPEGQPWIDRRWETSWNGDTSIGSDADHKQLAAHAEPVNNRADRLGVDNRAQHRGSAAQRRQPFGDVFGAAVDVVVRP